MVCDGLCCVGVVVRLVYFIVVMFSATWWFRFVGLVVISGCLIVDAGCGL